MELNYVSFQQAQDLQKVGFPQYHLCIDTYYDKNGEMSYDAVGQNVHYAAPFLEVAIKWLEEERQIYIFVLPEFSGKLETLRSYTVRIVTGKNLNGFRGHYCKGFATRDQANSAGLSRVLELMLKV